MELMKRNLCRSKHKYELKLKIKGTKRSKNSRFKAIKDTQNQETIKPNKGLLRIVDIVDEHDLTKHIWIQKLKTQKHNMNQKRKQ